MDPIPEAHRRIARLRLLLRRLIWAPAVVALYSSAIFGLLRLAPGGPFDGERALPPEIEANIAARYGLDQPLPAQYAKWMGHAIRADLGESFHYLGRKVEAIVADGLQVSLALGSLAFALAMALGIPAGVASAVSRGRAGSRAIEILVTTGLCVPSYLAASVLVLLFSLGLGWLPPALWEGPESVVLPAASLAIRPAAMIARLTRAQMTEALRADFVRTARGKGVSELLIAFKHALRNAILPVLSVSGPLAANLVTGSFLIETLFQIPGMGHHFVSAVVNRDYPLVSGVALAYGVILIGCNALADLSIALADPRARIEA